MFCYFSEGLNLTNQSHLFTSLDLVLEYQQGPLLFGGFTLHCLTPKSFLIFQDLGLTWEMNSPPAPHPPHCCIHISD